MTDDCTEQTAFCSQFEPGKRKKGLKLNGTITAGETWCWHGSIGSLNGENRGLPWHEEGGLEAASCKKTGLRRKKPAMSQKMWADRTHAIKERVGVKIRDGGGG